MSEQTPEGPHVRIDLGFFKSFPTVAGLLRDTGARRVGARTFILDGDCSADQTAALMALLQHSRDRENSDPVKVTVVRPTPRYDENELIDWWGTVDQWR